jgi:tetratricopeptide (TPR) repeat protein
MEARDIANLVARADRERALGHFESAIQLLRRALSADPDSSGAHASLALALLGTRRLPAADREAQLALLAAPESAFAHYAGAAVRLAQRRLDDAWGHCAVAMLNGDADALVLAADIRRYQERIDEAIELVEQALAADPEHVGAMVKRGWLAIDASDLDGAARWSAQALAEEPGSVSAHVLAGHLALRRGDLDDATSHVRLALSEAPEDPEVLQLFAGLQARRSWLLGLWWRWAAWAGLGSERRRIAILLGVYLVAQLGMILAEAGGADTLASVLSWSWLAFCAYTWIAPGLFRRRIQRELAQVRLRDDF